MDKQRVLNYFGAMFAAMTFWGTFSLQSASEPVRKIVMISTQNCPACKVMNALLQQVVAKSGGKIIIEVKLYDQARDFLTRYAIGHIDFVPYLCVLIDDRLIQTFPSSSGFKTAQQIWDALDKTALQL